MCSLFITTVGHLKTIVLYCVFSYFFPPSYLHTQTHLVSCDVSLVESEFSCSFSRLCNCGWCCLTFLGWCFSLSSSYVIFLFSNLYLGYCPTHLHRLRIYLHSLEVAFLWLSEDLGCSASPRCSKLDIFICMSNEVSPLLSYVRLCALLSKTLPRLGMRSILFECFCVMANCNFS